MLIQFFGSCKAQNEIEYSILETGWKEYNLKGKVKKAIIKSTVLADESTQNKFELYEYNMIWYKYPYYLEFDDRGMCIKDYEYSILNDPNRKIPSLDSTKATILGYSIKDFKKKSRLKTKQSFKYPTINPLRLKVNSFFTGGSDGITDTITEVYHYEVSKGLVKQEKYYIGELLDPPSNLFKEKSRSRAIYIYNEKELLIGKDYYLLEDSEVKIGDGEDFHEMEFNDRVNYKYTYDDKNRLVKVSLYVKNQFLCFEEKYYYRDDNTVEKLERFILSQKSSNPYDVKNTTEYYNGQGDVTQSILYNSPEDNYINKRYPTDVSTTFYYDYQYDSHGNWIECKMYLEGERTDKPSVIATRKIEYYND